MDLKNLLRPTLAIIFAFGGVLVAKGVIPETELAVGGVYLLAVVAIIFAVFGFILPDLTVLATKAGVAVLAKQIVGHLPAADRFRKRDRRGSKIFGSKYGHALVVDTSVLIDGRLVDIVRTGFILGTLLVMPSVIEELHKLADSADDLKRAKGRRGLDALEAIKSEKNVKLEILSSEPKEKDVDAKLVKLAKNVAGKVVTVDFNLNKVAKIKGVDVANINELANALKTAVLPNERLRVQISSVGRSQDQGIAYLPDGTMVVVEKGAKLVNQTVEVLVQRVLQTAAGKMIFAALANDKLETRN